MVWRFWTDDETDTHLSDWQWAHRQAAEAQNHIFDSLGERYGLRIIPGSTSFLVLPNNISRSTAVGAVLHPGGPSSSAPPAWLAPPAEPGESESATEFDFVLAVGKDEKLMRRLNELDGAETCSTRANLGTDAKWRLDPSQVVPSLWRFVEGK